MARILVIEDDAGLRARLVKILQFEGHDVLPAADGREGIEIARRERPDLVISDLMMPGINGFGTCRALRDDPRTRSIPILVLTALGSESDRERLQNLGAAAYLTKPFRTAELLETLRLCLAEGTQ